MYPTFNDLPLVETGCDSYASWHPAYKHLSPTQTTEELVERMLALTPNNMWMQNNGNDVHLVITGGEPLLGWQRAYTELLQHERMRDLQNITFETNGTQELHKDFRHTLLDWTLNPRHGKRGKSALTFSVSAKLSASGEKWEDAICPEVVCEYQDVGYTYLKFVVSIHDHVDEALEVTNIYRKAGFKGPVYLMPVGGVENIYALNNRRVADLAMKEGLRYSDRLQVPLFKNEWGT
jgi:organic radical activating enzyme